MQKTSKDGLICKGIVISYMAPIAGYIIVRVMCMVVDYKFDGINWYVVLSGFLVGMVLYGIGELIDISIEILNQMIPVESQAVSIDTHKNTTYPVPQKPIQHTANGDWICPHCKTKNPTASMVCKDCGKYR